MFGYVTAALMSVASLLSPRIVGAIAIGLALLAPSQVRADTSTVDPRLRVVFYPALGVTTPGDNSKPLFTTKDVRDNILVPLSTSITSAYPLYYACAYDLALVASPDCDPTVPAILVTT